MNARKPNCWEVIECGREPGGPRADEFGPCLAAVEAACDDINEGTNAGRICWAVAGTFCREHVRDRKGQAIEECPRCGFFRRVKYEEGTHFQLLAPGLGVDDPAGLHRLLNNVVQLISICRDIFACLAIHPLLRLIAEHALRIIRAASATAYLFDSSGENLVVEASAGSLPRPDRVGPQDGCPVAEAARTHSLCRGTAALLDGGTASVAAVSVGGHDKLAGVLEIVKADGELTDDDEWFLRQFALIAGLGIETATRVADLQQLKRFDKAKSRFVAVLMHHISSPLATISCSLQALTQLGDKLSPEDRSALMANSLERIDSVQSLSRRLLDLAAIRGGHSLGALQPVRPIEPLRDQADSHQAEAAQRGIQVVVADRSGGAQVLADPDGLRIIFANLLGNAIKYTPGPDGRVDAEIDAIGDRVRVTVRDTGIGIPPDEQSRIFEEFHRAENVVDAGARGFGIGLAVVRELVDRYGGDIHLESAVGEGTTFAITFPKAPADAPA